MITKTLVSMLSEWKDNYAMNKDLPDVTLSAVVSLDTLKKFIKDAESHCPGFTGVRFYFVRFGNMEKDLPYIQRSGDSKLSQLSLAAVPVKDFDPKTQGGTDYRIASDKDNILTLTFCMPSENNWDEGTGLCPPICHW
jgi:hypothetical protein